MKKVQNNTSKFTSNYTCLPLKGVVKYRDPPHGQHIRCTCTDLWTYAHSASCPSNFKSTSHIDLGVPTSHLWHFCQKKPLRFLSLIRRLPPSPIATPPNLSPPSPITLQIAPRFRESRRRALPVVAVASATTLSASLPPPHYRPPSARRAPLRRRLPLSRLCDSSICVVTPTAPPSSISTASSPPTTAFLGWPSSKWHVAMETSNSPWCLCRASPLATPALRRRPPCAAPPLPRLRTAVDLLCDEATSALHSTTEASILNSQTRLIKWFLVYYLRSCCQRLHCCNFAFNKCCVIP